MVTITSGVVRSARGAEGKQLERVIDSWQKLTLLTFYEDCRGIVQIVEETESEKVYEKLGFSTADEFYLKKLQLSPRDVSLVYAWVKKNPEEEQGFDKIVADVKAKPTMATPGGDRKSEGYQGTNSTLIPDIRGTTQTYTLRRLKRDNPELFERVEAGELSPNAAAIQAGFRAAPITITVKTDPVAFWRRARERLGEEYVRKLLAAGATQ